MIRLALWLTFLPVLAISCLWFSTLQASQNQTAKIVGHLQFQPVGKAPPICERAEAPACNDGDTTLVTTGSVGVVYDLYLLVVDADSSDGVAGVTFGIAYNSSQYSGVDVFGWNRCADLEFPYGNWPASGSGNTITWNPASRCQDISAFGDTDGGVTAVIGAMTVYAYSDDVFQVTVHPSPTLSLAVASCAGVEVQLAFPDNAGHVGFGSLPGYDPCAVGDTTAPGTIEDLGEGGSIEATLLRTLSGVDSISPILTWTAPGDDGAGGSKVRGYQLRYVLGSFDQIDWTDASEYPFAPFPEMPGERQVVAIEGLEPGVYTFKVRSLDDGYNFSHPSNAASVEITTDDWNRVRNERVPRGDHLIYVAGYRVEAPSIEMSWDGSSFLIDGRLISLERPRESEAKRNQRILDHHGNVPIVAKAISDGLSPLEGMELLVRSMAELQSEARTIYSKHGFSRAYDYVARTQLVESVSPFSTEGGVYVKYKGFRFRSTIDFRSTRSSKRRISNAERANIVIDSLIEHLERRNPGDPLILVTSRGDEVYLYGDDKRKALAQIQAAQAGDEIPPGPWSELDALPLSDFTPQQ